MKKITNVFVAVLLCGGLLFNNTVIAQDRDSVRTETTTLTDNDDDEVASHQRTHN